MPLIWKLSSFFDRREIAARIARWVGRMSFGDRSLFAKLVATEHASSGSSTDAAAVIAYHELRSGTRNAPWARAAVRIASALLRVLPTVLITNSRDDGLTSPPFSKILNADLLQLSGLGTSAPVRALCGLKITALLHGWSMGALPENVLLLDHDVVIMHPRALLHMLDPLRHYDLAGVMEGVSRGWDGRDPNQRNDSLAAAPDPAGRGWEVNSGVLAIRKRAAWLVKLWQAEFKAGLHLYEKLTGVDQSALMWLLAHEPGARLFPMPPVYNFRAPTLYSRDLGPPAAFHSRTAMRTPSLGASAKAMSRLAFSVASDTSRKILEGAGTQQQEQERPEPSNKRSSPSSNKLSSSPSSQQDHKRGSAGNGFSKPSHHSRHRHAAADN